MLMTSKYAVIPQASIEQEACGLHLHIVEKKYEFPLNKHPPGCGQSPQTLRRSAFQQAQRAPKVQDVRCLSKGMVLSTVGGC